MSGNIVRHLIESVGVLNWIRDERNPVYCSRIAESGDPQGHEAFGLGSKQFALRLVVHVGVRYRFDDSTCDAS